MKKSLFLMIAAAAATLISCSKENAEPQSMIPEGYSKVYFDAGVADTKAFINGLSIEWTGDEQINIWYKDAAGNVCNTPAEIEYCSGKTAKLSAVLPNDAPKNEFIAELNGVSDSSEKQPFGSSTSRARYKVATEQTAGANGFDPEVFGMGARWKYSDEDTTPHFTFISLCSLLKINVTNNANSAISKITLSCDNSIANSTYWSIRDDGTLSLGNSNNTVYNTIALNADVHSGETKELYFIVSAQSKEGAAKLENMSLAFEFADTRTRTYTNSNPLDLGHSLSTIGSFTIAEEDLPKDESYYVPFGASWDYTCLSAWKNAGFKANEVYAMSALEPNQSAKAFVMASYDMTVSSSTAYWRGHDSYFEFYAAEAGTGVLTFRVRLNKQASNTNPSVCRIKKNDEEIFALTNTTGDKKIEKKQVTITVEKGDKITVMLPNDSNTENRLVLAAGASNGGTDPITWTKQE